MDIKQLEAEALKLERKARAELAKKILESLEDLPEEGLSEQEIEQLWAEEAVRRDAELDENPDIGIPSSEVFREVRARFK